MEIAEITRSDAIDFILPRHYSGRKPQIKIAFGLFDNDEIIAALTIGKPASSTLCTGSFGKENSSHVYEINRVVADGELSKPLSWFVSRCLREVSKMDLILFSYADTGMGHHGYIYQACNFIYTGCTKKRLEFYVKGGHSRHGNKDSNLRQVRTSKHRYVFLATRNKKLRNKWINDLNYPVQSYPKGDNSRYTLGNFKEPEVVTYKTKDKS